MATANRQPQKYLNVGILLLQISPTACDSATSTHTSNEDVHFAIAVRPDLWSSGFIVDLRVVGVLKLLQDDSAHGVVVLRQQMVVHTACMYQKLHSRGTLCYRNVEQLSTLLHNTA